MNTALKDRMQCVCVVEVGDELLEPPKRVKLSVQTPLLPAWCSWLPQLAPCYKQVAKFTFSSTKSGTSCKTYTSMPLSMKVSSMQLAHAKFPSGLVKVSVKRRGRGKIVVFIPLKEFLNEMKTEDEEADKLVLHVSCNDSRIERTRDLPHPGGSSSRKDSEQGKMQESVKEYTEKAEQGEVREYNEHIEGVNCQCFKYKNKLKTAATSREDLETKVDETANRTLQYSRYTTTLKSRMVCTCVMEVGEGQHEPPRRVTLSVQTPAPAWCCGLPITYFKQMATFTFNTKEHGTSRQSYTSMPLILNVYRLKRAHTWSPSALVKVSLKQRRGGKIEFFTPVQYFLNHMETNDDEADELVLRVSCKNARMERTRWEGNMQQHQEITAEENLYEEEAQKDEGRSATTLLDLEGKDAPNPEETILRTPMQVMEMKQQATHADGKYTRSKLDDLMDLLEKEMDCAETSWTKEEEDEGGSSDEGTQDDDDELNEQMENCTEEDIQDDFSEINRNSFEEHEDVNEQGRTSEGSHVPQPLNTCIVQGGTIRVKGLAKLALILLVVMCLVPVVEHPYLPFRLDLP